MDKTNWSTTAPEYKNVTGGAVTVYVKVTNPNYVTVETSGTVTITKAPLTITANSHSWTHIFSP